MSNGHGALDLCGGRKRGMKVVDVEYLFSKILTPSDVGKLNRLLIPRQCAEECFLHKVNLALPLLPLEQ
jgi:hypothetical protein